MKRTTVFGLTFIVRLFFLLVRFLVRQCDQERLIGTIRCECLDHVIVFSESSLRRHLLAFSDYYHRSRTHLSLQKDTPDGRPIQPMNAGKIVAILEVGKLHHRYERRAA